jgi:hypothetical protein
LGLSWNFGVISDTAMVVDATSPGERARVQGSADVLIALAGAGGVEVSGVLMAATSYADPLPIWAAVALALIPVLAQRRFRPAA